MLSFVCRWECIVVVASFLLFSYSLALFLSLAGLLFNGVSVSSSARLLLALRLLVFFDVNFLVIKFCHKAASAKSTR